MSTETEIIVRQGNSRNISVTVTDADGAAYDLTDHTCELIIRKELTADVVIEKTAAVEDITDNVVIFHLLGTDTNIAYARYKYEVRVSEGTTIQSVCWGTFTVKDSLFVD